MYIHEEITKAVLPLLEKYDLELIDLIGEMNHAAWELSVLNKKGIDDLIAELTPNVESNRRRSAAEGTHQRSWWAYG